MQLNSSGRSAASPGSRSDRTHSRLIASVLAACVILLVIEVIVGVLWISREHNRLAASGSRRMVEGGINSLEDTLSTITLDFAIWPAAVDAVERSDMEWLWENIGISAAETGTTDLMMIVPPRGTPFGWTSGMADEASTELLSEDAVNATLALLEDVPAVERTAPSHYVDVNGTLWLLSAARLVHVREAEVPTDDADIPKLVFGFAITDETLHKIGRAFLIDDLELSGQPEPGQQAIAMRARDGTPIRYAAWTPPEPGTEVVRTLSPSLTLGFLLLLGAVAAASQFIFSATRRLEDALRRARAADIAKTEFLGNVSHELRTPMNGIIGIASLLERTRLDEQQRRMVGMLNASAQTQMRLISDLLDVTTIESGRINLGVAPFAPAAALRDVVQLLEMQARQKSLALHVDLPEDDGPELLGDVHRFKQIATNLVGNAIKFTESGCISVRLFVEGQGQLHVLHLEVADTGPGIAEEDRRRIFERFVQLDGSVHRAQRGCGLGLTITQSLVNLMGGRISLESAPGKGSRFLVGIPFPPARPGALDTHAA